MPLAFFTSDSLREVETSNQLNPDKEKSPSCDGLFSLVGVRGLARILRARNFIFENKFSREDFLAKCHWHFSPNGSSPLTP